MNTKVNELDNLLRLLKQQEKKIPYPTIQTRREWLLQTYRNNPNQAEAVAELGELDGSDTDMADQLQDAGFGSAGPM